MSLTKLILISRVLRSTRRRNWSLIRVNFMVVLLARRGGTFFLLALVTRRIRRLTLAVVVALLVPRLLALLT